MILIELMCFYYMEIYDKAVIHEFVSAKYIIKGRE